MKWLIGVDEAGRGPLAGPVAVGAVIVPTDFDWTLVPGVADSKQMSSKDREAVFGRARELKREGALDFAVSMVSARVIDRDGITTSIRLSMERALSKVEGTLVNTPVDWSIDECAVLLDGGLEAPRRFTHQRTIKGGDRSEKVIGLASIMAKVTRDRYMVRLAKRFPNYGFETHKGYGTAHHRRMIEQYGFCTHHRMTFCKNIFADC